MYRDRDYHYRILGLRTGASLDEVKAAYRRLVKLYHPDRNPSMDAEIMYREIRAAYEALLNSNIYKGTGTTQSRGPEATQSAPGAAQNSAPPRRAESSAGKKRET
ncbi:MAG: DnaJ domain-containing protein, partial [Synergistaceae bacterium]|nr:DnaJ domain-containing protein [Synergistaceae bacterium]